MKKSIKLKITVSLIFTIISFSAYAQNKKEQIQILNSTIDSLTNLSKQDGLKFTALENELKSTINEFKTTVNDLKSTTQNKNEEIKNLTLDLYNQKKSAAKKIDSLIAIYTSLKNQPKSDFNFITVNYTNLVNGYKVKAAWLPLLNAQFPNMDRFVTGPAVLQFSNTKDSVLFSVYTSHFILNRDLFSITYVNKDSINIANLNTTNITLQYKVSPEINSSYPLGENEFGFVDVDFDGKKELIVQSGFGQRNAPTYDAYYIGNFEDEVYATKLSDAPFNELWAETEFDYAAKTITTGGASGFCNWELTTYSKKGDGFIPTILVKRDTDTAGNCIEYTYKIDYKITKNLQLIKKEALKN